jgi:hypothetical protein
MKLDITPISAKLLRVPFCLFSLVSFCSCVIRQMAPGANGKLVASKSQDTICNLCSTHIQDVSILNSITYIIHLASPGKCRHCKISALSVSLTVANNFNFVLFRHVQCWEESNGPIAVPADLQTEYDKLKGL